MSEQIGWRGFIKALRAEAPNYATLLPQLPRLLHQRLHENPTAQIELILRELVLQQQRRNQWLIAIAITLLAACGLLLLPLGWLWAKRCLNVSSVPIPTSYTHESGVTKERRFLPELMGLLAVLLNTGSSSKTTFKGIEAQV